MKIIEMIKEKAKANEKWFSVEFYPYKTTEGVYNLFDRCDRFADTAPLFADITWGAGGSTSDMSLEIASALQNYICLETQMHLTCTNMHKHQFADALVKCKEQGIQNILALRGDPPRGEEKWEAVEGGFSNAADLVKFIREEHGDHFAICVAGYPEGHIECVSKEQDIQYLKEKVDAGADMIITQLFYDANIFFDWVKDCRAAGITVPIIPGIMPITSYKSMKKCCGFSKTYVPQECWDNLERLQDDVEASKEYGATFMANMCKRLLDQGVQGLHMYTMNQEGPTQALLEKLGMLTKNSRSGRMPWRESIDDARSGEDVRPIFWSNRPKSYLQRTKDWETFPEGRWGGFIPTNMASMGTFGSVESKNRAPVFNDPGNWHNLADVDFSEKYKETWGAELKVETDIYDVFVKFVKGEITTMPWNEVPLREESHTISTDLLRINRAGFLSINSQPRVDGMASDDPKVGWGPAGGRVYQKAYVEFFCSPVLLQKLLMAAQFPEFETLTIHAIDRAGNRDGNGKLKVNAVTWGIFPESEVKQPTVVDPEALESWKTEAFQLWEDQWLKLYEPESASYKVLSEVIESYFLVTIVDNDYWTEHNDMFMVFTKALEQVAPSKVL